MHVFRSNYYQFGYSNKYDAVFVLNIFNSKINKMLFVIAGEIERNRGGSETENGRDKGKR